MTCANESFFLQFLVQSLRIRVIHCNFIVVAVRQLLSYVFEFYITIMTVSYDIAVYHSIFLGYGLRLLHPVSIYELIRV